MPPTAKVTREMVLEAALDITRREGFGAVNARSLAARLGCSTRPIFTCYENMEAMKMDFLEYAYGAYRQYVARWAADNGEALLAPPLAYLRFAKEEPHLFRLLFVREMALEMRRAQDFYTEPENAREAEAFARRLGLEPQVGREVFLDLFLYTHGAAVLTAAGKLDLSPAEARRRVEAVVAALAAGYKGGA